MILNNNNNENKSNRKNSGKTYISHVRIMVKKIHHQKANISIKYYFSQEINKKSIRIEKFERIKKTRNPVIVSSYHKC